MFLTLRVFGAPCLILCFAVVCTACLPQPFRKRKSGPPTASRLPGMSVRPRLDDPAALVAMLDQLSPSPTVRSALSAKGFASLGSLAFAVSDFSDADEVRLFVRSTLSLSDTDDAALVSADSSCLRRLLFEASSAAPPKPALGSGAPSPAPSPSASSAKIAVPDLLHLRKSFLAKYPGELLTPDSAPSLDFLSLLKNHHDSSSHFGFHGDSAPPNPMLPVGKRRVALAMIVSCSVPCLTPMLSHRLPPSI